MTLLINLIEPLDNAVINTNVPEFRANFEFLKNDDLNSGIHQNTMVGAKGLSLFGEPSESGSLDVLWGIGTVGSAAEFDNFFKSPLSLNSNTISTAINWLSNRSLKPSYLPEDSYSWQASGYLYCPTNGDYIFGMNIDDAGDITIDNEIIKGVYSYTESIQSSSPIALSAGYHVLKIRMSEGTGGDGIGVYWKKPEDSEFIPIPPTNFANNTMLFESNGVRISDPIHLIGIADNMFIKWNQELYANTSINVKVALNEDSLVPEDSEFSSIVNNSLIVPNGTDVTNKFLWIKIEMSTMNTEISPLLSNLLINIPNDVFGDIQFEIDTISLFNSPLRQTIIKNNIFRGAIQTFIPIRLINNVYYWRIKITSGTDIVTSEYKKIRVESNRYKGALYQHFNTGIKNTQLTNKRVLYQYENLISYLIQGDWIRARNIRIKRRL